MAFEQTGVEAQVVGFTKFMSDLNSMQRGFSAMTGVISGVSHAISNKLINALGDAARGIGQYLMEQDKIATPMKQLGNNILTALSPAVTTIVDSLGTFVDTLAHATSEGGALYPVIVTLGAALSLLADGFKAGVNEIVAFIDNLGGDMNTSIGDIISNAFQWGAEIISALAEGMASAITTVLGGVMDMLSGVLGFFLAPGSPPRVAPDIDQWGTAAMDTYLQGFTDADFSILEGLQGPLKEAMSELDFKAFNKEMIKALSGEGVDESFYTRIAQAAGEFGAEIAKLAKDQVGVAQATEQVAAAEKAAELARNQVGKTQTKLSKQRREYNDLVRKGASPAILAAKLKEMNATEKELQLNQKRAVEAQDAKDTATSQLDLLKAQLSLQEKLVQQLLDVAKAEKEVTKEAEKGPSGGAEKPTAPKAGGGAGGFKLPSSTAMNDAIDKMKEAIKTKLADIFAPLSKAWAEIQAQWTTLQVKWEVLMINMRQFYDERVAPIVAKIYELSDAANKTIDSVAEGFSGFANEMQRGIGNFIDNVKKLASEENLKLVRETAMTLITKVGDTFAEKALEAWQWGVKLVTEISGGIGASFQKMITAGAKLIDDLRTGLETKFEELKTLGSTIIQKISDGFTGATDTLGGMGTAIITGISNKIAEKWADLQSIGNTVVTNIKDGIANAATVFTDIVTAISTNITTAMGGATFISDMWKLGSDIVTWIVKGINANIKKIGDAFKGVICDAFPWIPGCGGGEEESEPGEQPLIAANRASKQFVMPATQPIFTPQQNQAQQIYKSSAIQVGPNYINNGLDTAMLQAMVERAMVRALR